MTGEMSKTDLTIDGDWSLLVETANLIEGAELYMLYNGHKLWFTDMEVFESGASLHGIYDERLDYFHINTKRFEVISPEELAKEIVETFGPEE